MNFFGFALFAAILALAAAIPAGHWELLRPLEDSFAEGIPTAVVAPQQEHGLRFARATCDLLSMSTPWGSANHSICAAHCLAMMKGFRGGRCINGVCHCRK